MFRVWTDDARTRCEEFKNVSDAIVRALPDTLLVTQDVALGDPVTMLIEDLADPTSTIDGQPVPHYIRTAARTALKERRSFDLHVGR